jgi:hypothetical protein
MALWDFSNSEIEVGELPVMDAVINALSSGEILCCVHCGRVMTLEDVRARLVVARDAGYLAHINCERRYFLKTNPRVLAGIRYAGLSEGDILRGLESQPFSHVMASVEKVWSRLSASQRHLGQEQSQRFSTAHSPLIEDRSYYNWEIINQFVARNAS